MAAFLPRNTDLAQLAQAVPEGGVWEVERGYVNNKLKGITLYCHPGGLGGNAKGLCQLGHPRLCVFVVNKLKGTTLCCHEGGLDAGVMSARVLASANCGCGWPRRDVASLAWLRLAPYPASLPMPTPAGSPNVHMGAAICGKGPAHTVPGHGSAEGAGQGGPASGAAALRGLAPSPRKQVALTSVVIHVCTL